MMEIRDPYRIAFYYKAYPGSSGTPLRSMPPDPGLKVMTPDGVITLSLFLKKAAP